MIDADNEPAAHYDRVMEAWALLLGDELHWGVFNDGGESLADATGELTRRMIEALQPQAGHRVLDVGCGSGAPARRLATDHGAEVLGITTSQVGVDIATEESTGVSGVSFELRDGTSNGLPDQSFDRVWALESSHLMVDRKGLIDECSRVLRPGGRVALCDIIRRREILFDELRESRRDFALLRSVYGAARMDTLEMYAELMEDAGLVVDQISDITTETLPTLDRWRATADEHRGSVVEMLSQEDFDGFTRSLDVLEGFWRNGTLGYGLISAHKPA